MAFDHEKGGLDLGLSAILESAAETPMPAAIAENLPEPNPDSFAAPTLNEYEDLAQKCEWSGLVKLCEERISQSGVDVTEPRLWWISAHLASKGMPVSFLTAPLEAVTKEIENATVDPRVKRLAAETLSSTARELEGTGDGATAVPLLERAAKFDTNYLVSLGSLIDREIARLRDFSGLSSAQIDSRKLNVKTLQAIRPASARTFTQETSKSSQAHEFESSSATIRGDILAVLRPRSRYPLKVAAVAVIALLGIWYGGLSAHGFFTSPQGVPELALHGVNSPELKVPLPDRIQDVSAFDGLYYDLKDQVASKRSPLRPAPSTVAVASVSHEKKVALDMSSPQEPVELQEALKQPEAPSTDGSADILFGGAGSLPSRGVAMQGGSSGQHRESFRGHQIFKVIVRTRILAQPSYRTEVLGMLSPGERVAAEARVDSWIQIRSTNGKIGFIFAQDAEQE